MNLGKLIGPDVPFVTIDVGLEQDITELDENDQEEFSERPWFNGKCFI